MIDKQLEAIAILKVSDAVTVNAEIIAQALGMNAGVLRKHVRDGEYHISKYEICNDRIRFFRKDFLQQIGEMPPEKTTNQLLEEIVEQLKEHNRIQMSMLSFGQVVRYEEMYQKSTGAATPML